VVELSSVKLFLGLILVFVIVDMLIAIGIAAAFPWSVSVGDLLPWAVFLAPLLAGVCFASAMKPEHFEPELDRGVKEPEWNYLNYLVREDQRQRQIIRFADVSQLSVLTRRVPKPPQERGIIVLQSAESVSNPLCSIDGKPVLGTKIHCAGCGRSYHLRCANWLRANGRSSCSCGEELP
jgi:hypothetical protein